MHYGDIQKISSICISLIGQRIVPPKQTAQSRAIGFGGGGGVMIMNQQNQNNELPPTPTWNIPSQYSMLQPPQQQNRNDIIQGTDHNIYGSNVYSPDDAVSPPAMATSEAPTNWHEPSKPGTIRKKCSFHCFG